MFYLFANCNFRPGHYAAWQSAFDDLAAHVYPNEPRTQTYYFGIPMDYAHDFALTTSMLAFEDLYTTHLNSAPMQKFLSVIPAHTTTDLDLNHYARLAGFLDRDGDRRECGVMLDQKITCHPASARGKVCRSLRQLVESVEKARPEGALTFMAFECLDDQVGARLFARFESRAAMEAFIRREDVGAFWQDVKSDVRGMEQRAYLPNGKGWLHRGGEGVKLRAKL